MPEPETQHRALAIEVNAIFRCWRDTLGDIHASQLLRNPSQRREFCARLEVLEGPFEGRAPN